MVRETGRDQEDGAKRAHHDKTIGWQMGPDVVETTGLTSSGGQPSNSADVDLLNWVSWLSNERYTFSINDRMLAVRLSAGAACSSIVSSLRLAEREAIADAHSSSDCIRKGWARFWRREWVREKAGCRAGSIIKAETSAVRQNWGKGGATQWHKGEPQAETCRARCRRCR